MKGNVYRIYRFQSVLITDNKSLSTLSHNLQVSQHFIITENGMPSDLGKKRKEKCLH